MNQIKQNLTCKATSLIKTDEREATEELTKRIVELQNTYYRKHSTLKNLLETGSIPKTLDPQFRAFCLDSRGSRREIAMREGRRLPGMFLGSFGPTCDLAGKLQL